RPGRVGRGRGRAPRRAGPAAGGGRLLGAVGVVLQLELLPAQRRRPAADDRPLDARDRAVGGGVVGRGVAARPRAGGRLPRGAACVYPWALRLLFVQLALVYFFNGLYKLAGEGWRDGTVLHYVLGNAGWARWYVATPLWLDRLGAWLTLVWELGFPVFVSLRR